MGIFAAYKQQAEVLQTNGNLILSASVLYIGRQVFTWFLLMRRRQHVKSITIKPPCI
jgi:hypothetical protein